MIQQITKVDMNNTSGVLNAISKSIIVNSRQMIIKSLILPPTSPNPQQSNFQYIFPLSGSPAGNTPPTSPATQ